MARLRIIVVAQETDGDVYALATCKFYEPGTAAASGSSTSGTPFAGNLYAAISGGSPISTTQTLGSNGTLVVWTTSKSRVDVGIEPAGGGTAFVRQYEAAEFDPADVATLTGAETLTNKTLTTPSVTGPATFSASAGVLESLEVALTGALPVQSGTTYTKIGLREGTTTPNAASLAPMLNVERRSKPNGIDTTNASDFYFQSVRYGSNAQSLLTADSGTATTITKAGAGWTTNQFSGMQIDLVAGTGSGQRKTIVSNTATVITISGTFSPAPDGTTTFVVNDGGVYDLYALTCYAFDDSSAKPGNLSGSTIAVSGFAKQSSSSLNTTFGGLFLGELDSASGNSIGVEIDIVNNQAAAAGTYPAATKQTIGLNIASFCSDAGYAGTYNSLGILLQSSGPNSAMRTGILFGANSALTYGIDFKPLTAGSTTPKPIRLGSGHQIVGRNAADSADVSFLAWEIDDTLRLRSTNGTMFESNAWTEWARINSAGLAFAAAAAIQTTTAAGLTIKTNSATRMEFGSGATIGVFGVTPAARASAYTLTYSTADKTHANPTSSALSGIASSTTGSALTEPDAAYVQATWQTNMRRIQDQYNALRTDVLDLKQLVNSVITDLQAYGWFQ